MVFVLRVGDKEFPPFPRYVGDPKQGCRRDKADHSLLLRLPPARKLAVLLDTSQGGWAAWLRGLSRLQLHSPGTQESLRILCTAPKDFHHMGTSYKSKGGNFELMAQVTGCEEGCWGVGSGGWRAQAADSDLFEFCFLICKMSSWDESVESCCFLWWERGSPPSPGSNGGKGVRPGSVLP